MDGAGSGRGPRPDLIGDDSRVAGFLDLADLDAERVPTAILDGFSQLGDDAVLTVYCTNLEARAMSALGEAQALELVHSVPHVVGTTFVLKRSNR